MVELKIARYEESASEIEKPSIILPSSLSRLSVWENAEISLAVGDQVYASHFGRLQFVIGTFGL